MLHLHSGSYHALMNSVNFQREVKSLTSSGGEFQILGPNVRMSLGSFQLTLQVVVFPLLTT